MTDGAIRILKFDLDAVIRVGAFRRVLGIGWQGPQLCVWLEAAAGEDVELRFLIRPTGAAAPDPAEAEFIGTAHRVVDGVPFVLHGFRLLVPETPL